MTPTGTLLRAFEAQWAREAAARLPPSVPVAPLLTIGQRDMDDAALERALGQLRWIRAGLELAIGAVGETEDEYLEAAE